MANLAIIPARGGSKGVPGKNLRPVAGRPLIGWSVLRACQALAVDTVLVSTDDEVIAEAALAAGAEVPFSRPAELATDEAPTEPVITHALDWCESNGRSFEAFILLQPTSPLRLAGTIDAAFRQFQEEGADSLVGVVPDHHFFWRRNGAPSALYDFRNRPRRQDIPPTDRWFRETGSIYISRVGAYRLSQNRLSGSIAMFVMNELEGWEIDTETDFAVMEALFSGAPDAN